MNDLLFYALILALLYYFFIYLPTKKQVAPTPTTPLTHSQFTQTETYPNPTPLENQKDLEKTLDNLIKSIQQLNQQIK